MRASLRIAGKDLSQRVRDRSAILLGLVAPLGLALIFSLIIPDTSGGDFHVEAGVVDDDGGAVAAGFIDGVLPAAAAAGILNYTDYPDTATAIAAVDSGALDAAYLFPADLSESVQRGAGATIEMVGNVDATIATQIARSVLESYTAEVDAVTIAVGAGMAAGASDPSTLAAAAQGVPAAVVLTDVAATSKQLDFTTFFSAGMAIFFLFFTVQFGVTSLLEERIHGTLPRLLAAPIGRWSVLIGKGIASFVLGLVSMVVLAVATTGLGSASSWCAECFPRSGSWRWWP
jgi:ABC-2 type transport system permease protein